MIVGGFLFTEAKGQKTGGSCEIIIIGEVPVIAGSQWRKEIRRESHA